MWLRGLNELAHGLRELIFPNECLVCANPQADRTDFRHGLCSECYRSVTADPHSACPRCAATVGPHAETERGCVVCRGQSFAFEAVVRLGPYHGRLRDAVVRMKGVGGEGLAEMMGRVFWESAGARLRTAGTDVVVPVPLHWRRRWGRGHNQSAAVARELALGLGAPFEPRLLRRVCHPPQQAQPTAAARRGNVKGAFRAKSGASIAGRAVLLVDDVMTTGSTAAEAARTLRAAGADRVSVAVLARR